MAATRGGMAGARVGAGTRGGLGRIVAMAIALAVVLTLVLVDAARAGTYRVAQCGWGVGTELDPTYPATEGSAFSLNPAACAPPPGLSPGMRFEGSVAPNGVLGLARARWIAPSGTRFSAAHLTWSGSQQPGNWQALAVDIGGAFHLLAYGLGITAPTPVDLPIDGQAWAFEALVQCIFDGPVAACTRSTASTMRLSDLTFTLEDQQPPQARLAGPLLAPGWRRGTAALELGAEDVGAGVAGEAATIDGAPILGAAPTCAVQTIEGEVRGTKMQPCPPTATRSVEVDTTRLADGVHTVHACATDFAGDGGCAPDAEIEVDNSPPEIAFDDADEGQVAATVSDRYSGPASGTISVRRADAEAWTDLPTGLDRDGARAATLTARLPDLSAGTYLFRAVAADGAGNTGSTQLRVSGSAAEVRRKAADGQSGGGPAGRGGQSAARRATRLTAHLAASGQAGRAAGLTVDYGTAVELVGRLSGAHGAGVAGRPVVVVARPAAGIGGAPERRRVLTGPGGRFEIRLPPGTSRRVTVSFHGGAGFGPAPRRSLALLVRAAVSLAADPTDLRTGEAIRLHGRVRLGPVHLAGRGKLVTIQYLERDSGRWRPALVIHTGRTGRFDARYRFRYITGEALIRLRATALPEAGWPYASGSSAPVTVEVRGG